jgi:hypothetical protein
LGCSGFRAAGFRGFWLFVMLRSVPSRVHATLVATVTPEAVREEWEAAYEAGLVRCMHANGCQLVGVTVLLSLWWGCDHCRWYAMTTLALTLVHATSPPPFPAAGCALKVTLVYLIYEL